MTRKCIHKKLCCDAKSDQCKSCIHNERRSYYQPRYESYYYPWYDPYPSYYPYTPTQWSGTSIIFDTGTTTVSDSTE